MRLPDKIISFVEKALKVPITLDATAHFKIVPKVIEKEDVTHDYAALFRNVEDDTLLMSALDTVNANHFIAAQQHRMPYVKIKFAIVHYLDHTWNCIYFDIDAKKLLSELKKMKKKPKKRG